METQRDSRSLGRCSLWLLLLGLVIPAATAQALSYEEAVLRAVDGLNQRSSDDNLYRLLELDPQPKGDEDPDTPTPVSFTVKETVCPRLTPQPLEQCPFKENGRVKQCVGTVILDPGKEYFDISCDEVSGPFWFGGADVGRWCVEHHMDQLTSAPCRAEKAPPTLGSSLHLSSAKERSAVGVQIAAAAAAVATSPVMSAQMWAPREQLLGWAADGAGVSSIRG
ncbi:PREDICTED: protegrin-2-like [Ceratotherium simum simum]|uniref:Protegrin-2-like n=1 Tax=Ceratotherium simum simum TaxID=73337 RepID=A0ABM1CWJ8_CERSS|nr:PREDICTED: protegrin-2-like [Ceratotherium simum simum]